MVHLKNRKVSIIILASIVFITTFSIAMACFHPVDSSGKNNLQDTGNGETKLIVAMHDSQIAGSASLNARSAQDTRNIQALNLTVRQIVINNPAGGWTTILDEDRTIDIIAASRADPVILSNVPVEPGVYQELRLVLSDGSTRLTGKYTP